MEIERKFVLDTVPSEAGSGPWVGIRQGYLAVGEGAAVRIRDNGGEFTLTAKSGWGMVRGEYEIDLSAEQFEALWPGTAGRRIEKRRMTTHLGSTRLVIDVFEGGLSGLVLAEAEFATLEQAFAFVPPEWLGAEVTDDEAYSNAALAARGFVPRDSSSSGDAE